MCPFFQWEPEHSPELGNVESHLRVYRMWYGEGTEVVVQSCSSWIYPTKLKRKWKTQDRQVGGFYSIFVFCQSLSGFSFAQLSSHMHYPFYTDLGVKTLEKIKLSFIWTVFHQIQMLTNIPRHRSEINSIFLKLLACGRQLLQGTSLISCILL